MKNAQRHIPMAIWLFVLGVGLIATPSAAQLSTLGNQLWFQDSPGVRDASEADDLFGKAVATGDFDNNGFSDLAIGIPEEDIGAFEDAGAVQVLFGGGQLIFSDGFESGDTSAWSATAP